MKKILAFLLVVASLLEMSTTEILVTKAAAEQFDTEVEVMTDVKDVGGESAGFSITEKSVLEALIAEAETITANMISESLFLSVSTALSNAKATLDNTEAMQDEVDDVANTLESELQAAVKETRDTLFEAIVTYKGLDGGILNKTLYAAYEKAYNEGKVGFWDAEKTAAELYSLAQNIKTTFEAASVAMDAVEKVLTGNVITESDRLYYPDMESDKLPNLSYVWTGTEGKDPDPEASGQDKNDGYKRLLSGVASTPWDNIPNICWGKWAWRGTTNLDFSLGEEAYVTGADFWENAGFAAGTNYCSDKIEVYTSDDGSAWTLRKEVMVDQSDCPNPLKGTRLDFDEPIKCRYVRVAVIDYAGYQVKYNEVVIRGFRTTQVETTPIVIENIDYATTGSKGERIISLDGHERVKVTGNVKNTTEESKNVLVISVAYKDGNIIDLRYTKRKLAGFAEDNFTNTMQLGEETGLELHTFVWDSFGSATPLSGIYTFGLGEHEMADFDEDGECYEFDSDSGRIRVWGEVNKKNGFNDVTLIVLRADVNSESIDTMTKVTDVMSAILYVEQTTPVNEKFAFEFFRNEDTDEYGNAYVTTAKGKKTFYRLLYMNQQQEKDILDKFNSADKNNMIALLDNYGFFFDGAGSLIDDVISKYGEDLVLNSVAEILIGKEYESVEELCDEMFTAFALAAINNAETSEEMVESIDKYVERLGIYDNEIYTALYNGKAYKELKGEMVKGFIGQNYTSTEQFATDFCSAVILSLINQARYADVATIIDEAREYLSDTHFDIAGYDALTYEQKLSVQKIVAQNDYESIDDFITVFNNSVDLASSTAKIIGPAYACIGGSNVKYRVNISSEKENVGYATISVKYPKEFTLKSLEADGFAEVEILQVATEEVYTTADILCIYSYDGKVLPIKTPVNAFDIYFDISKSIALGEVEIELTDASILMGDEDYPFDKLVSAKTTIMSKLPESVAIISGADFIDEPTQYVAEILSDYPIDTSVIWEVSDESIATISQDGVLTPLKSGTVTVTATAVADLNVSATKIVNVVVYARITSFTTDGFWVDEFVANEKEYTIYVDDDVNSFNISATYSLGTLKINGMTVISGRTRTVALTENETQITVERTNVSGYTNVTYTLNVIKNGNPLICSAEGNTYKIIFNENKIDLSEGGHLIVAMYDEKSALTGFSDAAVLADDKEKTIEVIPWGAVSTVKVMLWKDISDVQPLCDGYKMPME